MMGSGHLNLLEQFDRELEVVYRGETYRVRDNGAVWRRARLEGRKRPLDEIWTFGTPSTATGYMQIASEVVHRIVATAFHGDQPSDKHVVDHIDTNCRNNRAENLRWVTRLENVLLNPITRRRVELAYGSLEAFFKNPGAPLNPDAVKNFDWMRTVSKEEAQESLERLQAWAASGKATRGGILGDWIFGAKRPLEPAPEVVRDIPSLTPNALQRNWKTLYAFELCSNADSENALAKYASRLSFGTVFSRNAYRASYTVIAEEGENFLSIVCNLTADSVKEWALTKVTLENGKFVHESVRSYFTLQGALKDHCNLLGTPFAESIDEAAKSPVDTQHVNIRDRGGL